MLLNDSEKYWDRHQTNHDLDKITIKSILDKSKDFSTADHFDKPNNSLVYMISDILGAISEHNNNNGYL